MVQFTGIVAHILLREMARGDPVNNKLMHEMVLGMISCVSVPSRAKCMPPIPLYSSKTRSFPILYFSISVFHGPTFLHCRIDSGESLGIPSALSPDICQRNRLLENPPVYNTTREERYRIVRWSIHDCAVLESSDAMALRRAGVFENFPSLGYLGNIT